MSQPLASIFCFCKNRVRSIGKAIDSLLAQTYPNIEIIVQDGASTDGTLEVLQSYGDKIKLVSEPDSGPGEGFKRAFLRCSGDYIGSCLSDEELLPHAAAQSVAFLEANPNIEAVHGDILLLNEQGEIYHEAKSCDFDALAYLYGGNPPNFSSAFFRRAALKKIGLWERDWNHDCFEYQFWCYFGLSRQMQYIPGSISKYGTHNRQLSKNPDRIFNAFRTCMEVIPELFQNHPRLPQGPAAWKECRRQLAAHFIKLFDELCDPDSHYVERIRAYVKRL